jgi:hypothetical protein
MKDEKWILAKIKEKANELGLKFNPKIFIANYVTRREIGIVAYLNLSPRYNKFGRTNQQRANNFGKFLSSKELRDIENPGLVIFRTQIAECAKLLKDPKERRLVKKLLDGLKFNSKGYGTIVGRPKARLEDSYDILFHEWIHNLLNYNNLGFYDTGGNRWSYNEGLTVFVEYYLGNYYGRDVAFLKDRLDWVKKNGKKTSFDRVLRYCITFAKLVEKHKEPSKRKEALIRYFKEFPAPKRTKFLAY